MRFYPSSVNKNEYHMIYSDRTHEYTERDVAEEFREWVDIISKLIDEDPRFRVYSFKINPRLKSTCAKVLSSGRMEISQDYIKHHGDSKYLHSTICHEAIHTFHGCWDHKKTFHTIGRYIALAGFNVEITTTSKDVDYTLYATKHARADETYHYKIVCQECGAVEKYMRYSGAVKNPQKYRCRKCHGSFKAYEIKDDGIEIQLVTIAI